MKKRNIAISLLLAACTFACACTDKKGGISDSAEVTGGVIKEFEGSPHYVEGTLHKVNVNDNAPVSDFVVNGQTEYKMVVKDSSHGKAAGMITQRVFQATGAQMPTLEVADVTDADENSRYIFMGCMDLFEEMGGVMPSYEELGVAGYQVVTVGKNVFINANSLHGDQLGAIAFLRATLGYDMLSEDCIIYEKDGKKMPAMDIVERPDFDYRQPNSKSVTPEEYFGMGYTYSDIFISTGTNWIHNYCDFVTKDDAVEHPEWLSNDTTQYQGCWTARGNQESYKLLVEHIANRIINFFKAQPTKDTIVIGQHDIGGNTPQVQNCKCTACQASFAYYGNTMAGAWLSLVNRASVLVDEYMESEEGIAYFGGKKEYNVLELVYHTSLNPPVEKDANGNNVYTEEGKGIPKEEMWFDEEGNQYKWKEAWTDEEGNTLENETVAKWTNEGSKGAGGISRVKSAPNVHFFFAASSADYTHSFYESENNSYMHMIKGWSGLEGDFFVWLYALNSQGLLYPYMSFDTSFDTTRFIKDLGAKYIFWQGQYQNENNAGFTQLRNYLDSKVEFDVNSDYMYYVNKFFNNFYGVGGKYMREFFDQVVTRCRYIEEVNSVGGTIHNNKLLYKENWPEGLINSWINLIGKAYDAIEEEYKSSDPEQYEIYRKNILTEELFPRYVLCTTYADSYQASELKVMRQKFLDDFYALNNTSYAEGRLMTEISDGWDLD